jgi:hypothetical protein
MVEISDCPIACCRSRNQQQQTLSKRSDKQDLWRAGSARWTSSHSKFPKRLFGCDPITGLLFGVSFSSVADQRKKSYFVVERVAKIQEAIRILARFYYTG